VFLPGLELCEIFYREGVAPLLDVPHAAARVGPGSEVLGFDTARSADHDWGPRLELFLTGADLGRADALHALLASRLPKQVRGWPTHFEPPGARVATMAVTTGPVAHRVRITDVASWSVERLGFDATRGVTDADWLATPTQRLAEVVGGAVYHDAGGELTALRERLAWYPDHLWREVLAAQWTRIAQEEAFVGRAAQVGDERGSRLVAARLVRELMRLAFLLERRYWPYSKWFGTAFARLAVAGALGPALDRVLDAAGFPEREAALVEAYGVIARAHNAAGLTAPVDPAVRSFHGRGFAVLDAQRFAEACRRELTDPWLRGLPPVGSVDQFADSTDVLSRVEVARRLGAAHSSP
jgi:hypothetical protein